MIYFDKPGATSANCMGVEMLATVQHGTPTRDEPAGVLLRLPEMVEDVYITYDQMRTWLEQTGRRS